MPKVLAVFLLLIATSVSAAEPKGFVLKGAFVQSDGSIVTSYFPGDGKVAIFKTRELCDTVKDKIDVVLKRNAPDMEYLTMCIPTPKGLIGGGANLKSPEA